jgi:3-oxoadipate enol-lactonase
MERLAADIALLLDSLGIERAAMIGHSMGGYVALAFARMFTERVARLALITSRLRADSSAEAAARRALADRVERERSVEPVIEAYLPRLLAPQTFAQHGGIVERAYEIARENSFAGMAGSLRGMALRASAEDIAEDLHVPVLVVAGGWDRVVDDPEARSIAASFPRAQLVVCEQSGHLPMLEERQRFGEAIAGWLAS